MQVYVNKGPEKGADVVDAGVKGDAGNVDSPEIKALKEKIKLGAENAADIASDIAEIAKKEAAEASMKVKDGAAGAWESWSKAVTNDKLTTAGGDLMYKAGKAIDGAPGDAQKLLADGKEELEQMKDKVLVELEKAKVELTQKIAQLDTVVKKGYGDAIESGIMTIEEATNTVKMTADQFQKMADKAIKENLSLPPDFWKNLNKNLGSYGVDRALRLMKEAQKTPDFDMKSLIVGLPYKDINKAFKFCIETGFKMPEQVWAKVEAGIARNTPKEALQVLKDAKQLKHSVEALILKLADGGEKMVMAVLDGVKEVGYTIPAEYWNKVVPEIAKYGKEGALRVLDTMAGALVETKDAVVAMGEAGADMAIATAEWSFDKGLKLPAEFWGKVIEDVGTYTVDQVVAIGEGVAKYAYDIPKEYWMKVGPEIAKYGKEGALKVLDTMVGAGVETKDAVVAMAAAGADMAMSVLEGAKEIGYDIPKEFWVKVGEDVGTYTADQVVAIGEGAKEYGYTIPAEYWTKVGPEIASYGKEGALKVLDTMVGAGVETKDAVVAMAGAGADMAVAVLEGAKTYGYDVPKEYWLKVGEQAADYTSEEVTSLMKGAKEYGYDLPAEFWTGVGEQVSEYTGEQILAIKDAATTYGYDIPKDFWVKVGPEIASYTEETAVAILDTMVGAGVDVKDAVVAMAGAGADMAIATAKWSFDNGVKLPVEFWAEVAKDIVTWEVDVALQALDTMVGAGVDVKDAVVAMAGAGADMAIATAKWSFEKGVTLPIEFWTKVGSQLAEYGDAKVDELVSALGKLGIAEQILFKAVVAAGNKAVISLWSSMTRLGFEISGKLDRAYSSAERKQKALEKKGKAVRTGDTTSQDTNQ